MAYNSERDNRALADVIQVIASRTAIAIIGAGVSAPLGYPLWRGLVDVLATEVERRTGPIIEVGDGLSVPIARVRELSALVAAKFLKAALGPPYVEIMRDLFGPREGYDGALQLLVQLPIQHFVTANYDPSLERAHERAKTPFQSVVGYGVEFQQMVTHINDGHQLRHIFHAHGRYDHPESIVLTEDDYGSLYTNSRVTLPLWALAQTRQFVFFGFSLEDFDLMRGFTEAKRMLKFGCRHFAVLDLEDNPDAEDNEIKRRLDLRTIFGIEPIFYLRKEKDFARGYTRTLEIIKTGVDGLLAAPGPAAEVVRPEVAPEAAERDAQRLTNLSGGNVGRRLVGDLE